MPNWCSNQISVEGPRADIERLLYQAEQKHLRYQAKPDKWEAERGVVEGWAEEGGFFWNFVTPPASIQTTDHYWGNNEVSKHPVDHWYDWNIANWDTKWDVEPDVQITHNDDKSFVSFVFESAWAPPEKVVQAMAEQYPMLRIYHEYHEEGSSFWGEITYDNGTEINRREGECDHSWYTSTYGFCPFVEWNGEPGQECPDCGEKVPEDDETAVEAST